MRNCRITGFFRTYVGPVIANGQLQNTSFNLRSRKLFFTVKLFPASSYNSIYWAVGSSVSVGSVYQDGNSIPARSASKWFLQSEAQRF